MALIVDRNILLQASWTNTIRLARWIGAKRLPTCNCPGCRAVVVGALERYMQGRSWDGRSDLRRGAQWTSGSVHVRSTKKRKSRSATAQACDS
jgi:hypothetical protein